MRVYMSLGKKIKNKILNSSDMFNFYKKGYELSNKKIKQLEKKHNNNFKKLNNELKHSNNILTSYNSLFNTLFLDYEFEPNLLLKNTFTLCQELLNLVDNVCKKYDLEYWLDRHDGFIPWDDDMDIGMMREDYDKFIEIFEEELKTYNIDNDITFNIKRFYNGVENHIDIFAKIIYNPNDEIKDNMIYNSDKMMFAGLDIFPYDYIKNPRDNIEDKFQDFKTEFYMDLYNNIDKKEIFKKYYNVLGLSYKREDFIIPGIEGTWGGSLYEFDVLETSKIFPLDTISFEGRDYPCPNDCNYYLEAIYGENYMNIPPKIRNHSRQDSLRNVDNVYDKFEEYIKKLQNVNINFKF